MKMNSAITPTSREKGKNKKGFMEDMWNGEENIEADLIDEWTDNNPHLGPVLTQKNFD